MAIAPTIAKKLAIPAVMKAEVGRLTNAKPAKIHAKYNKTR